MNIEYFKHGAVNTPLVLIYGNDPAGVEILRRAIDKLVIDIFDRVAVHELPGYVSINDCKLFIEVDRDDIGVWLLKKDEPVFICSLQKETWIKVINKLKPFTDPHIYIYSGGCFPYLTNPAQSHQINLLISSRRGW
jgi:hypothetical protein